jgi:hypothetical protein
LTWPQYLPENISVTESGLPVDIETRNAFGVPAHFAESYDDLIERGVVTESGLPVDIETRNGIGVPAHFAESYDDLRERGAGVIACGLCVILFWFM